MMHILMDMDLIRQQQTKTIHHVAKKSSKSLNVSNNENGNDDTSFAFQQPDDAWLSSEDDDMEVDESISNNDTGSVSTTPSNQGEDEMSFENESISESSVVSNNSSTQSTFQNEDQAFHVDPTVNNNIAFSAFDIEKYDLEDLDKLDKNIEAVVESSNLLNHKFAFLKEDLHQIRLLQMLNEANVPHYMFKKNS
jgi:hypothetical protein